MEHLPNRHTQVSPACAQSALSEIILGEWRNWPIVLETVSRVLVLLRMATWHKRRVHVQQLVAHELGS